MSLEKKIISGLAWGQIGMSGRTITTFFISIMVARSLGVENYGIYAVVVSCIELLTKLTDMGIYSILNTYIPRFKNTNQIGECSFIVRRVIFYRMILLANCVFLLHIFADQLVAFIGEPSLGNYFVLISIWFLVRCLMDGFIFVVIANVDMKYYTLVEISVSIFQLLGVCLLLYLGMKIDRLIILMILVNGIQFFFYGMRSLSTITPDPVRTKLTPVVKFGLVTWISTILQYFRYKSIDVFMILYFLKDADSVAYYDIAYLVSIYGGSVLLTSLDRLTLPFFSEAHTRFGIEGLRNAWEFLTKISIYLSAPILVFLIVHSRSIIRAFYTDIYMEASPFIIVFSIFTLAGLFLASETSVTILFPLNKERIFLYLRSFNGILNIVLNLIFIPRYGILGAVISTGGSTLVTSLIELGIALFILKARLPYDFMLKMSLIISISVSWTLFFRDLNLFQIILMSLVYGVMITMLMLRFFRFNNKEMEVFHEFSPAVYNFLTIHNLLRG